MRELEHKEAVVLTRWVARKALGDIRLKWLFHIPNGGARNKIVAAKLKAEGVKPGVSDYLLPAPVASYRGLFLELKAPDKTYPTKEQREFLADMVGQGYAATWCRGFMAAADAIEAYLNGERIPLDFRDYYKNQE
jgi:hypothetical protein